MHGENVRYIRLNTPQGIGYGCFSIFWSREDDELVYRIGSSFCSPKDTFSKTLAKEIATGRTKNNFQYGSIKSEQKGFISDDEFIDILVQLFAEPFNIIPNWARKAFNRNRFALTLSSKREDFLIPIKLP